MEQKEIYDFLIKLQAITKAGLTYSKDPYALANYKEISELSKGFLENLCEIRLNRPNYFTREIYPTPSISVRTIILDSSRTKVLMVKEKKSQTWSLPGGWCDLYKTPSEAAKNECKEEAGCDVEIIRLVGLLNYVPQTSNKSIPEYVVCFEGKVSGNFYDHEFETDDVRWFSLDNLPVFSPKVKHEDIERMICATKENKTIFD